MRLTVKLVITSYGPYLDGEIVAKYTVKSNSNEWHIGKIVPKRRSPYSLGDVYDSEGPTYYPLHLKPLGKIKTVMVR